MEEDDEQELEGLYLCLCDTCYPNSYQHWAKRDWNPDKHLRPRSTCATHRWRYKATSWKDRNGDPISLVPAIERDHTQQPTPDEIARRLGLAGPPQQAAAAGTAAGAAGAAAAGQGNLAGPGHEHGDVLARLLANPGALAAVLGNNPGLLAAAMQDLTAQQRQAVLRVFQQANPEPERQVRLCR